MARYIHARSIEIDQFFNNHITNFSDDILFENGLKKIIAVNFPPKISEQKTSAEFKRTPRWLQIKCKQAITQ